ncbi:hypothetical protein ACFV84_13750 [Kitasatospora sp. NPDC059811]|uniref:hypothetical protein n=1 Tax=Streptomycetaceae TaxID=2062 RepID=UPI000AE788DF|nr:hypothetical protein [Streptomyces sp. MJM8645]
MPSFAVDEAWHGLILCTARYATFCQASYGQFLHHHPQGGELPGNAKRAGSMREQLHRTAVAWSLVARPDEKCVLWDLDVRVGVPEPWSVSPLPPVLLANDYLTTEPGPRLSTDRHPATD